MNWEKVLPRRQFLQGQFLSSLQNEKNSQQGFQPIRPPWANLTDFFKKCTACGDCIRACENQILIKGQGSYPEVDFYSGRGECSFCKACVNVCQAGVFRFTDEIAWKHKVEIQTNCLTQHQIECRSCEDSCEQRAIRFKRQMGGISMPQLALESCNGCGACLSACPSQAINILHYEE